MELFTNDELWFGISDHDVVRVCLLLVATIFFMGRETRYNIPDNVLQLVDDLPVWNSYLLGEASPEKMTRYNLYGFVWAVKVRFERPHKPVFSFSTGKVKISGQGQLIPGHGTSKGHTRSYANAVNGIPSSANPGSLISSSPALVLDDNCLIERDFSKYVMGRVKDVHSISNIMSILHDEDDDSVQGDLHNSNQTVLSEEEEEEFNYSKVEGVLKTIYEVNSISDQGYIREPDKQISEDPFGIYNILHKNQPHGEIKAPSSSLSHPPGFTPVALAAKTGNVHSNKVVNEIPASMNSPLIDVEVVNSPQEVHMEVPKGSIGQSVDSKGGSVLGVLEEVIRVGQAIGFSMEGCEKDIEAIIGNQGDDVGETILMGDFNEVRSREEWRGSVFNPSGARVFNYFIDSLGLVDVKLEGYSFTRSHPSATKISKLDRFLVSDGVISLFPSISAICLDRHLSDHRPILLRDVQVDFGPTLFRFFHSWFCYEGFDEMVEQSWRAFSHSDRNAMIRFKKKLQDLKIIIRQWIKVKRDQLSRRCGLIGQLHDIKKKEAADYFQKSKKRSQLAIRGVFVDGLWENDPMVVKEAFHNHFASWFKMPTFSGIKINFPFPDRLSPDHASDIERDVSRDEIREAVWNCGENKSPGPDGYTFEFFKKYWGFIGLIFVKRLITSSQKGLFLRVSAFVSERQILDGPFIINEFLHWCKRKHEKAMFFKVDFAKAYDSVRLDYLIDVLGAFRFRSKWCQWIRGTFCFAKASILVNGSPSNEFNFHCGLKQGDPLASLLFILVMESLHLSISRMVEAGLFKGIRLNSSLSLSHLFYADDALIIGVGVSRSATEAAASSIGCSIIDKQFHYLGIMGGGNTSRHKAWEEVVLKIRSRLSKWKAKTLSIGAPKGVLKKMESLRNKFFIGVDHSDQKITWIAWDKVLASKLKSGLRVSSFFALNRALLFKWIWRFISQDGSLWFHVMQALYGSNINLHSTHITSNWCSILREMHLLKVKGFDFMSLCSKKVGDCNNTSFWFDIWKGESNLHDTFPRMFALETDKQSTVAAKIAQVDGSFRRPVRGGLEQDQFNKLISSIDSVSLSSSQDRWVCNASGDGSFRVKDIRNLIDDLILPSWSEPTRWVKFIPIKINIFVWRARRDCLPTRYNLVRRGVFIDSNACPICDAYEEDIHHILFQCDLAQAVLRRICRWWDLDWQIWSLFANWNDWFSAIKLATNIKSLLEDDYDEADNSYIMDKEDVLGESDAIKETIGIIDKRKGESDSGVSDVFHQELAYKKHQFIGEGSAYIYEESQEKYSVSQLLQLASNEKSGTAFDCTQLEVDNPIDWSFPNFNEPFSQSQICGSVGYDDMLALDDMMVNKENISNTKLDETVVDCATVQATPPPNAIEEHKYHPTDNVEVQELHPPPKPASLIYNF
uniref:RNA-directed DNA polymerase, eukaryota, reverse transcriptase zinc-binding domain protein n=1 Tax=Tanacetum cinerariifolium TaxID=118510 RepID=A0A699GX42_TANCI|nr:RNA-directed DNA polymerase, eukaryota, reverse transcriptase zinc-binding domain protein [Tanacetum cinerariifolium]